MQCGAILKRSATMRRRFERQDGRMGLSAWALGANLPIGWMGFICTQRANFISCDEENTLTVEVSMGLECRKGKRCDGRCALERPFTGAETWAIIAMLFEQAEILLEWHMKSLGRGKLHIAFSARKC